MMSAQPGVEEALEADRKFLGALQELILLATDVLDTSVDSLISRPTCCVDVIKKLQKTGQYWDEHEDWPGRDWYVDILMAVAGLSRVLDWWEAEKGFWKFDEDVDEPITFVMPPFKDTPQFDLEPGMAARSDHSAVASPLVLPSAVSSGNAIAVPTLPPLDPTSPGMPSSPVTAVEPTGQAVEDLRRLAEQAKSINIVTELSLQGQEILYVNDAIYEVVGYVSTLSTMLTFSREPEDVLDLPITELLAPADMSNFSDATERLLEDDGNTVQLRFRFEVHDMEDAPEGHEPGPVYIELEGVGMLIRENNEPSHTMWVMKPVTACQVDNTDTAFLPHDGNISTDCVLCRICEREIVLWFFEKHNETCDAVHRLEAEIAHSNECLDDLQQTVQKLCSEFDAIDRAQHQGLLFYTLPEGVSHNADDAGPQGIEVRRVESEDIHELLEIIGIVRQIETPSVQEDEADLPFNLQRYLSRESEDMLVQLTRWTKPTTPDRALGVLCNYVDDQIRTKQKAVARMQSTIRYSEKTRHEWEDKVNQILSDDDAGTGSDSGSDTAAETTVDGPENVSPGHRKIAPLARLPITQGHPQRPGVPLTSQNSVSATTAATPTAPPEPLPPAPARTSPVDITAPASAVSRSTLEVPSISPETTTSVDKGSQSPKPKTVKGHARRISTAIRDAPLSPRISSSGLPNRPQQPSIRDFQIIKPISRGAFGSVYLAKKVATGDYYAIKALKKSDMIAKNQITNVKAERTILMNQATSPYVVRLFFSFQSKDYLYLVMEYLNGGDCSTLVKTLGSLPVDWARNYIGELVLGLEYLHARNVAHR
jgi:serine/threonine-protein kinase RIM15